MTYRRITSLSGSTYFNVKQHGRVGIDPATIRDDHLIGNTVGGVSRCLGRLRPSVEQCWAKLPNTGINAASRRTLLTYSRTSS